MIKQMNDRIKSNRGDSLVISNLLLIVLAVLVVTTIGVILYKAIKKKAEEVGEKINSSDQLFQKSAILNITDSGKLTMQK